MSDGQTEACEANAPVIDWSQPVERSLYGKWIPADVLWQDCIFVVVKYGDRQRLPDVLRKSNGLNSNVFRNAPSPPQYRPFTEEELQDLVGRKFRKKLDPSEIGIATLISRGSLSVGGWKFGADALLDELHIDDNGQWVPAGVRL